MSRNIFVFVLREISTANVFKVALQSAKSFQSAFKSSVSNCEVLLKPGSHTSNFAKMWHGLPCWIFRRNGLITWLQVLNHDLLFSVPSYLLLDDLIKETTCNVMVDHLQSRVTPWRQYASHVKVRGTSSKMDVYRNNRRLQDKERYWMCRENC